MKIRLLAVYAVLFAVCSTASFAAVGWANYQWPCNGASYADNQNIDVYTQAWKGGCTDSPGPCADLSATIYYKRASEGTWNSAPMSYLGDSGNNDEYTFQIPAAATVAGDDEQYYFVWHDASDNTDYNPTDHCGGGSVPPLTLHITPATSREVTVHFSLDMRCLAQNLYSAGVFFAGDFQGWTQCASGMTDANNDGIYEGSFTFAAGSNPYHEYKHNRAGSDGCQWENSIGNRSFVIDESGPDQYLPTVKWDNYNCCSSAGPAEITGPGSYCITLCVCPNALSIPLHTPYNPPVIQGMTIVSGCNSSSSNCSQDCIGGIGNIEWGQRQDAFGNWYLDFCLHDDPSAQPGCFCITIENILPVEFGTFAAVPGNNAVTLNWNTLSESDNDHFEITRNGSLVSRVNSLGNSANGHSYSWVDRNALNGVEYAYTLSSVSVSGERSELATASATPGTAVASDYAMLGNYPNPFNPVTTIRYSLGEAGLVTLSVFDLNGRLVSELVNAEQSAGEHEVEFSGAALPSGIYFYTLTSGSFSVSSKMVLMK